MQASGACIFLRGHQCSIHDVKPTICATYPFRNEALWSGVDWNAEAQFCEGITPVAVTAESLTPNATSTDRFAQPHAGAAMDNDTYSREQVCCSDDRLTTNQLQSILDHTCSCCVATSALDTLVQRCAYEPSGHGQA